MSEQRATERTVKGWGYACEGCEYPNPDCSCATCGEEAARADADQAEAEEHEHYLRMWESACTRTDAELLSWVVEHAGCDSVMTRPRWSNVRALFGLGSTSARALCRRFGHDPDEEMGGRSECECGATFPTEAEYFANHEEPKQ